jgi:curved DNA-binding protein CbpA
MNSLHQAFQSMGLDAHCSFIDAKQRYRQLAKELHPDRVSDPKGKARAERDMKRLNADFELIEIYFTEAKKHPKVQSTAAPKQPSAKGSDADESSRNSTAGTSTESRKQRNSSSDTGSSSKSTSDSNNAGRTASSTDPRAHSTAKSKQSTTDSKSAQQSTAKPKSNTSKKATNSATNQHAQNQSQERTTQDAARAIWRNRMAFQQADQQKKKPTKRTVESFILRENQSPTET